jgi:spore germination protein YaaH
VFRKIWGNKKISYHRLTILLLAVSFFTSICASPIHATTVSQASIWVDDQPVTTNYFMQNGHLMVPAGFFKNTGVTVSWDATYQSVVFNGDGIILALPSGKNYSDFYIKELGKWQRDYLSTRTTDLNDGTYIPLNYVAQKLGLKVLYNSDLQRTSISFQETVSNGNAVSIISVAANSANVYTLPNSSSQSVDILNNGEEFPILATSAYYYKIQLLEGKTGWIKKSETQLKKVKRIVMGWNYGGNTDTYLQQNRVSPNLNVVSPRWFTLSNSDDLVSVNIDPRYVQESHDAGQKVWPLLGNRFDPVLTDSIISNADKRQKLVTIIRDSLNQHGIDGINVDFENMDIKNKSNFVSLVRELKQALKPHGKIVSVDVSRENPDPFWSGSYDRFELGKAADYIIMMGYDEHWGGGGKAGSVASLPWVREGIELLMNEIPSHKIILGVPFYTREWVTNLSTQKVRSYDRTMHEVEQIIADKGLQKSWDEQSSQHYVEYIANGEKHQIWLEDKKSMEYRRNLVNQYHLSGVAAWRIGTETPDIWSVFDLYR